MPEHQHTAPPTHCAQCGASLPDRQPRIPGRHREYCSALCQKRSMYARRRPAPYDFGFARCEVCGARFRKRQRKSRYCSRACYAVDLRARAATLAPDPPPATCRRCGSEFIPSRPDRLYCSRACRLKRPTRPAAPRACAICGGPFPPRSGTARYCSDPCRGVAWRDARMRRVAAKRERDRFYTAEPWRSIRARFLAEHPHCDSAWCRGLDTPATVAHHVEERLARPDLALEPSNLLPLCAACHSRIHHESRGRTWVGPGSLRQ